MKIIAIKYDRHFLHEWSLFSRSKKRPCCAFSLLEITISTLLVSFVLVSSLQMVGSSLLTWQAMDTDVDAQALAHELMSEILAAAYEDPETVPPDFGIESDEPSSSADRLAFDDTDDYNNWIGQPPVRRDSFEISGFTGWERNVEIKKIEALDSTVTLSDTDQDQGVRRVTVTIKIPGEPDFSLIAIVGKLGAVEKATGVDTDFVTGVTIELSAGSAATTVQGIDLINHANGP